MSGARNAAATIDHAQHRGDDDNLGAQEAVQQIAVEEGRPAAALHGTLAGGGLRRRSGSGWRDVLGYVLHRPHALRPKMRMRGSTRT